MKKHETITLPQQNTRSLPVTTKGVKLQNETEWRLTNLCDDGLKDIGASEAKENNVINTIVAISLETKSRFDKKELNQTNAWQSFKKCTHTKKKLWA